MTKLRTILAALLLFSAPSQAQTLKAVMVNTNGVVQSPTNFWKTNASTNFQQFIETNNFAYASQGLIFTTNRGQYILRQQNTLRVLAQTNLNINHPHSLVVVASNLYAFQRQPTTAGTNALVAVFSNAHQSLSNGSTLTLTNAIQVPEAVYDATSGKIFAASIGAGVFQITVSNNAISQFATNNIDLGGTIAHYGDFVYLGFSNVVQKLSKSNGSTVSTITNTNLSDIHAFAVTPDGSKLIGATAGNPAKAFVVTLSNFAYAQVATYSNTNAWTFTDDIAADNDNAWMSAESGEGSLARYNFASNSFTDVAASGRYYFVFLSDQTLYAAGPDGAATFNKDGTIYREFYTANALLNEMAVIGSNVFLTDFTSGASLYRASWDSVLDRVNRDDIDDSLTVSNVVLTNTNTLVPLATGVALERNVFLRVEAQSEPGNINLLNIMTANNTRRRVGDRIVVQNVGTNTVNVRRGTVNPPIIRTLAPNQMFEAVATATSDTDTTWFTNSIASIGATWLTNTDVTNFRTAIGLGATNIPTFSGLNISNNLVVTVYGLTGWDAQIDLEEKDLTAGSGYDWNLGGSGFSASGAIDFNNTTNAATTRTNLGLLLPALTNTSNVTMMRALAGSTNTNQPFSGTVSVVGTNNTNTLTFSNGILQSVQ